jgi:beta-phosphoglucomutase family hydrolase
MRIAAIFDMDGVIVDNMDYHTRAWEEFFRRHNPPMELDEFMQQFGRTNRDLFGVLFQRDLTEAEVARFGEEKEALYREIYALHVEPVPGLIDFLEELKRSGVPTAVATSAPRVNLDFVFDHLPLQPYFAAAVDSSDVVQGKPDPEIFLKAAAKLNVSAAQCVVFEDSFAGIQSGKNAGMKVVGVATSHPPEKLKDTDLVISDFTEIRWDAVELLWDKRA